MLSQKIVAALLGLAILNLTSGLGLLFFRDETLIPILHWIRSLSEEQLQNYVAAWARLLLVFGLLLIFLATLLSSFLRRRVRAKRSRQ